MGKTYSLDLREKVITYLDQGGSKKEASELFNIGLDTVYRWTKLHQQGSLQPKKRTSFYQVVDLEALKAYVAQYPDHTITQIAQALKLGRQTVFRWLARLHITRKKRLRFIKSAKERSEVFSKKH